MFYFKSSVAQFPFYPTSPWLRRTTAVLQTGFAALLRPFSNGPNGDDGRPTGSGRGLGTPRRGVSTKGPRRGLPGTPRPALRNGTAIGTPGPRRTTRRASATESVGSDVFIPRLRRAFVTQIPIQSPLGLTNRHRDHLCNNTISENHDLINFTLH